MSGLSMLCEQCERRNIAIGVYRDITVEEPTDVLMCTYCLQAQPNNQRWVGSGSVQQFTALLSKSIDYTCDCGSTMTESKISEHTKSCTSRKVRCNCGTKLPFYEYQTHIKTCVKYLTTCTLEGCEHEAAKCDMAAHMAECQFRQVTCQFCGDTVTANGMQEHVNAQWDKHVALWSKV